MHCAEAGRNTLAAVQWKAQLFARKSPLDRRQEMTRLHAAALRLAFTSAFSGRLGSRAQLRGLAGDIVERVAREVRPSQLGAALGRLGDCLHCRCMSEHLLSCLPVYYDDAETQQAINTTSDMELEARRLQGVALSTAHIDCTDNMVRQQGLSACHALCRATLEHYDIEWEGPRSDWHDWYDMRTDKEPLRGVACAGARNSGWRIRDMFEIERAFKTVVQVVQEVSVSRHQLLGDAHAESSESAAALSALEVLHMQLRDAELVANRVWDTHDDPRGKLDVVHMNWKALSVEQSAAAIRLGWTTGTWDANQLTLIEGPRCVACDRPKRREDPMWEGVCSECTDEIEDRQRQECRSSDEGMWSD